MVIIESIVASAVSGFILKQVAQAHIRKHSTDDENSKLTEEGDETLSQETPTNAEEEKASYPRNQIARAALIQDSTGHVRHAIVFEGPVELSSLSSIDLWDGPAEVMKVESWRSS